MASLESDAVTLTLERGLAVLSAFRAERSPLSNAELARRTGYARSVVSRLTATLIELGYLRRVAGGRAFRLDSASLGIGHAFLEANPVRRLARPVMQRLADELDLSVAIGVGSGLEMIYLAYCSGARVATLRLGEGSVLPMGFTAIGRAWLYALPEPQRSDRLSKLIAAGGTDAATISSGALQAFRDLADAGSCLCMGEFQRDAYGIAVPLYVGRQRTPMALSCGAVGSKARLPALYKRVTPRLLTAATEIEALLADIEE